jgi:RND family efflux transporter MFP subunit
MTHRLVASIACLAATLVSACGRGKAPEDGAAKAATVVTAAADADSTREKPAGEDAAKEEVAKGGEEDAAPAPVVGAKTAAASLQRFDETLTVIGSVNPRPGHYAELSAPGPTRVMHIYVGAGDVVASGDPLVEFDRAPFDAAAVGAHASLLVAQRAYDRAQRLSAAGVVARKDVDQAAADLAQAQTTDVTARRSQELATLRAPLAGVVTHMSAVLGASVDAAAPVVGVADPGALDIVLGVSPREAPRVRRGDSVEVTAGQSGLVGEPLGHGVVVAVGVALDTTSRTIPVRAHIAHPTRALMIGETVTGRVTTAVHQHAVTIPVQALVPDGDALKVFVVGPDGIAHARPVSVGGRTERLAEITDGLHAGERVVTDGAFGVEDSAKVVPIK